MGFFSCRAVFVEYYPIPIEAMAILFLPIVRISLDSYKNVV